MTLETLRSDEILTKWFASVYERKQFQAIWKMLQDSHPMRHTDGAPVTASTAEKKLGVIEGYELALERIKLCAHYQALPSALPPASFADPDFGEQQQNEN